VYMRTRPTISAIRPNVSKKTVLTRMYAIMSHIISIRSACKSTITGAHLRKTGFGKVPAAHFCSLAINKMSPSFPILYHYYYNYIIYGVNIPDRRKLNWHMVPIELVILVITTLAGAQIRKIMHKLDRLDPLDHLEAKLVLHAQSKRSPMRHV